MVTDDAHRMAQRLLDAQVAFIDAELSGDRFLEVIERDVDDLLDLAEKITVAEFVPPEQAKATAISIITAAGDSPVLAVTASAIADAIYELGEADDHLLGEVISRDHVEALAVKILGMERAQERAVEQLGESPQVATVASWFVNTIATELIEENAQRAEKLPGIGGLVSAGRRAARTARAQADRHFGDAIDAATARGARAGLRRVTNAFQQTIADAPLLDAVMEVWDLHADEPMADLRSYLSGDDLDELVAIVHDIIQHVEVSEYFEAALDASIDAFYSEYGDLSVGELLALLGIERDRLVADAQALIPPMVESVRDAGMLDPLVRSRLEAFWDTVGEQTLADGA